MKDNVINLNAHRWMAAMLKTLPPGKTLREACIEEQKKEIELFKRLNAGKKL